MGAAAESTSNYKSFIGALGLVTVVTGAVLIGLSTVLVHERRSELTLLDDLLGVWVVWTPMAIGIVLVVVGCLGCITTLEDRVTLSVFGPLQLAFGVVVIAAGAAMIAFLRDIEVVSANDVWSVSGSSRQENVNDYITGFFGKCCVAVPETFMLAVSECTSSDNQIDSYCYFDEAMFDAGASTSSEMCEEFASLCKSDDTLQWGQRLKDAQGNFHVGMQRYAQPSAIVFVVFGVFLLLAAAGSIFLCQKTVHEPASEDKTWKSSAPERHSNGMQNV